MFSTMTVYLLNYQPIMCSTVYRVGRPAISNNQTEFLITGDCGKSCLKNNKNLQIIKGTNNDQFAFCRADRIFIEST